ncbi:MAG: MFS transporter [Acetobacteraceae bacterium]|nr:MFS transporter [Acetobacteraceae bacterium]
MSQSANTAVRDLSAAESSSTVRWRIFAIVFVVVVINLIDRTTLSIAMPTIGREFALSPAMQGVLLSSFFWSYALLQVPGGWLIDRFGPRRIIAGSTVLWGAFQALAAMATGGLSLLLTRVGLGAAEAPVFPAGAKLSSLWLSPQERGRGAVFMDSGAPLGAAFGGVIISFLILVLQSWRLAFLVAGLATIALGAVAWRYLRDDPATHPGVNAAELSHITGATTAEPGAVLVEAPPRIAPRSMAGLLVGRMAWAMINFGLLTWGPSYLAQARGFDLKQMGYATFVIFLCGMAGSLFAGFTADALLARGWARSTVYKGMLGLSGLATLSAFIALPYVSDPVGAVAILSATLFFLYWGSLYWSLPTVLAPREKVGLLGGVMNFAGSSSGIAVPIITGGILQLFGNYYAVLLFFAGCAALYIVGTSLIAFPALRLARSA